MPSKTISTRLNYVKRPEDGEAWLQHYIPGSAGIHRLNLEPHDVQITDMRSLEEPCTLDKDGFELVEGLPPVDRKIFIKAGENPVATLMAEQAVEMLKKRTGASYVYMFNHVTRFDPTERVGQLPDDLPDEAKFEYMGPFCSVHVDQSYRGGMYLLQNFKHLPEIASRLTETGTKGRYAVINVWRPVSPVTRDALALCSRRSVEEADLRPWESNPDPKQWDPSLPLPKSEIWRPIYNPKHDWYYASELQTDEALLIKCFETQIDGHSRAVPHSAFQVDTDRGPPRESVEFRCMVFWDDGIPSDEKCFVNPSPL